MSGGEKMARWALIPVAAVLATLATQWVVYRPSLELLSALGLVTSATGIWATKAFTSVFMGAAMVGVVWWIAPATKARAASIALVAVAIWAGRLVLGGVGEDRSVWLIAMGVAGMVGSASAWWLLQRRRPVHA